MFFKTKKHGSYGVAKPNMFLGLYVPIDSVLDVGVNMCKQTHSQGLVLLICFGLWTLDGKI